MKLRSGGLGLAGDSHLGVEWHIVPELCRPVKMEQKRRKITNIFTRLQGPLNTSDDSFRTTKTSIHILQEIWCQKLKSLVSATEFSFDTLCA